MKRNTIIVAVAVIACACVLVAGWSAGDATAPATARASAASANAAWTRVAVPRGGTALRAVLATPPSEQTAPAVVLMHGCSGMWDARHPSRPAKPIRRWLATLTTKGYVALAVDSYSSRGIKRTCGRHGLSASTRARDAYAAISYLRSLPYVIPGWVTAVGWGPGGNAALASVARPYVASAPSTGSFKAAVAFAPDCARLRGQPVTTTRIVNTRRDPRCSRRFHPATYRDAARADSSALRTIVRTLAGAPRTVNLFDPGSWLSAPLPDNAQLDPDQSAVAGLRSQVAHYGTWVNTTSWSAPVYVVGPDQAPVTIHINTLKSRYSTTDDRYLAADFASVPLPPDARPAGPTATLTQTWVDHSLIVYQPSSDTAWEIYHLTHSSNGTWWATGGGKISHVSQSNGQFDPWPDHTPHGLTGSGITLLGTIQRVSELQQGVISHPVSISIPHVRAGVFRSPATRTDGEFTTSDAVAEGTRFRLPASLDIDSLPLTPYAKMVAKAIQTHGLVVVDRDCRPTDTTKCPAVTFYAEDPRPYPDASHPNPYDVIFGGVPTGHLFDNFPWDKLQVLPQA